MLLCTQCPRKCNINRLNRDNGYCKTDFSFKINIAQLHYHEEPVLSGNNGSGTIFFSHCNLRCVFCQNYQISQLGNGYNITQAELEEIFFVLEKRGAHNINLVTPSHFSEQLIPVLEDVKNKGLKIPVVWNSNGYEDTETLKKLEGLVDIYLPDFKYGDNVMAKRYSDVDNYFEIASTAIKEMYRQVGNLKIFDGLAERGLMIRILVLPDDINGTEKVLRWLAENIGTRTYISLMGQYYPTYKARNFPELTRGITKSEYEKAISLLEKYGFERGFIQDVGSDSSYTPDFIKTY